MKSLILLFVISLFVSESPIVRGLRVKVERDEQLVVPGFGAEQVILGDRFDELPKRLRSKEYRIIEPVSNHDLFKHVFKISAGCNIDFDRMMYFEEHRFILLVKNEIVVSIMSFNKQKVTVETVDLSLGVKNFISAYKKYSYEKLKSNKNVIYNFKKLGIGIVDDGNDDVIDIFYIFPKSK